METAAHIQLASQSMLENDAVIIVLIRPKSRKRLGPCSEETSCLFVMDVFMDVGIGVVSILIS
jgi:hypothetical protein